MSDLTESVALHFRHKGSSTDSVMFLGAGDETFILDGTERIGGGHFDELEEIKLVYSSITATIRDTVPSTKDFMTLDEWAFNQEPGFTGNYTLVIDGSDF